MRSAVPDRANDVAWLSRLGLLERFSVEGEGRSDGGRRCFDDVAQLYVFTGVEDRIGWDKAALGGPLYLEIGNPEDACCISKRA